MAGSGTQADAADQQLVIADQQLDLAREQAGQFGQQLADQARKDAVLRRRELEARADTLAPAVLIRFEKFKPLLKQDGNGFVSELTWPMVLPEGEDQLLFVGAELTIMNVSSHTAVVWLDDNSQEFSDRDTDRNLGASHAVVLGPGEERIWDWERAVLAGLFRNDDVPTHLVQARLLVWVSDLGVNIRDRYELVWGWNHVSRDGSRLKISARPTEPPAQPAATMTERVYDRLDPAPEPDESAP